MPLNLLSIGFVEPTFDVGNKEALPGQIRAQAVFKCVRVTAVDDGDDEYAYHAMVKIGGHVFKGFLYDQGVEAGDGFPNVSELHLGDGVGGGGTINNRNGSSSSPLVDPSDVYNTAASGSGGVPGFLGGSNYGFLLYKWIGSCHRVRWLSREAMGRELHDLFPKLTRPEGKGVQVNYHKFKEIF
uniref:Uncharacterized protein n=1 Tax=Cucumis melo TaxID=3656 RepID=A0A9I9EB06_CUCME